MNILVYVTKVECPLLALSGQSNRSRVCPLLG